MHARMQTCLSFTASSVIIDARMILCEWTCTHACMHADTPIHSRIGLQVPFLHCSTLAPATTAIHPMLADSVCAASLEPPLTLFSLLQPSMAVTAQQVSSIGTYHVGGVGGT